MAANRINHQPDILFMMIIVPEGWIPKSVYDAPPRGQLISETRVASFAEAFSDLVRSNTISIKKGLREWAVIQTAEAEV